MTNHKFKVGDRVSAEFCQRTGMLDELIVMRMNGTIKSISPHKTHYILLDDGDEYPTTERQLRKLKPKKKLREFWVNVYPSLTSGELSRAHYSREDADEKASSTRIECLHLKEVRKK